MDNTGLFVVINGSFTLQTEKMPINVILEVTKDSCVERLTWPARAWRRDAGVPGCRGVGVSGCRGAGVPGGGGAGVPGCRGAGVPGCRGAGVPGCRGAGVPGCRVDG